MARTRDRIFAGFFAALFLLTSSVIVISLLVSHFQNNSKAKTAASKNCSVSADLTKAKEPTMDASGKLEGTKLGNFTPIDCINELKSVDTVPGTGTAVTASDTITVDYTGAVAKTGVIFQSSKDSGKPVAFPLSGVIPGWTQGIPGMQVGGTRRLFIPAALAYGSNPPPGSGIPADADLVFDVTLHKIGQ